MKTAGRPPRGGTLSSSKKGQLQQAQRFERKAEEYEEKAKKALAPPPPTRPKR